MNRFVRGVATLAGILCLGRNVAAQELITFRNDLKGTPIIISVQAAQRDQPTRSGKIQPGQAFTFQLFSAGPYDLTVEPVDEPGGAYSKRAIDLKTLADNLRSQTVSLKGIFDFQFGFGQSKTGEVRYGYNQVRQAVTMTASMNSGQEMMGLLLPEKAPVLPFEAMAAPAAPPPAPADLGPAPAAPAPAAPRAFPVPVFDPSIPSAPPAPAAPAPPPPPP
jgi:hypothetical protein